jgi:hypothetical protein
LTRPARRRKRSGARALGGESSRAWSLGLWDGRRRTTTASTDARQSRTTGTAKLPCGRKLRSPSLGRLRARQEGRRNSKGADSHHGCDFVAEDIIDQLAGTRGHGRGWCRADTVDDDLARNH